MSDTPKVRTCLWFDGKAGEAASFYVSLLPDSRVETPRSADGDPLVVKFTLAGAPFMLLKGGPHYQQSPAASISVSTEDQAETDRLWSALTADGGEPSRCGWLKDRFGVSWQIVPRILPDLLGAEDRAAAERAQQAMLSMTKLEIDGLRAAFAGDAGA